MKKAFTLAEVLVTLGIIGVVAALTLPTLIQNHKRQENIVRLKKVYSILQQDIDLAKVENGDIDTWNWDLGLNDFVETYLLKNLQIAQNCKREVGCWNSNGGINKLNGVGQTVIDSNSHRFYKVRLVDGTLIAFEKQDDNHLHFYIDTNGGKLPNRYGYDCAMMTFVKSNFVDYAHDIKSSGLYFFGFGLSRNNLLNDESGCSKEKEGLFCGALFQYDGWKMQPDYKF